MNDPLRRARRAARSSQPASWASGRTAPRPAPGAAPALPAAALALAVLAGCRGPHYEPAPLDAPALVAELRAERAGVELPFETLGERDAAALLAERSPALREAIAAYHTALARVDEPARLPNPTVGLGAVLGFGPDIVREVVPYGSFSWQLPLARVLDRTDELSVARAQRAEAEALAVGRELRLELRARLAELGALRTRAAARRALVDSLESTVESTAALVEAGAAGAIDAASAELELARERTALFDDLAAVEEPRAALAALLDLPLERIDAFVPVLEGDRPRELPALAELTECVDSEHPDLLRLRLEYAIAERALALEVARAHPLVGLSASGGRDPVDDATTVQLAPTFTLPLFDRNQAGILEAERRRTEVAERFRAAAARALAEVEAAHRALELALARRRLVAETLLPAARAHEAAVRRAVDAGSASRFQLVAARREVRSAELERSAAELAEQRAWSALERAVGLPLTPAALGQDDPASGGTP